MARKPRALNLRLADLEHTPAGEGPIHIGRPSKWGNPFLIGRDGTREQVIAKYRNWVCDQPDLMASLHELRGRDLLCYCAPFPCHGEVLLELANMPERGKRNGGGGNGGNGGGNGGR